MDCTTYVAKTKALISCTVTVQLIYAFICAYAKSSFSHEGAHIDHPTAYKIKGSYKFCKGRQFDLLPFVKLVISLTEFMVLY